jgi:hypothetical protein
MGYELQAKETFRGQKNGIELDVLISLYGKAA